MKGKGKGKGKGKAKGPGKGPKFNPWQPTYKYQKGLDSAAKRAAKAQLQPLLQDIGQQRSEGASAHKARQRDINQYYGYDLQARQDAYGKMNTALNNLITTNAGLSTASQQALAAALRGSAATEAQQAALLGVKPTNNPEAAIRAAQGMGDVSTLGTLGNLEAVRAGAAGDIGVSGVGHREAGTTEDDRFNALLKELTQKRSDVMARLPGLTEDTRRQFQQDELAKAQARFQRWLARSQFGFSKRESNRNFRLQKQSQKFQENLAKQQQKETERSNRAQEQISWAGIRNERQRLNQAVDAAVGDEAKAQAKARADRFNGGIEILTNWFKPTKQELGKGGKMGPGRQRAYENRLIHGYSAMLDQIMAATGMHPIEARRVILAAADRTSNWGQRWVKRAQREIDDIKATKQAGKKHSGGPGKYKSKAWKKAHPNG